MNEANKMQLMQDMYLNNFVTYCEVEDLKKGGDQHFSYLVKIHAEKFRQYHHKFIEDEKSK